jgi:DNA-binding CsgD family transcriptional regulator
VRSELLATVGRARRHTSEAAELTPQEMRIAWLASEDFANAEVAAQLLSSANTVDYDVRKGFSELAVSSRTQLHLALPDLVKRDEHAALPAV